MHFDCIIVTYLRIKGASTWTFAVYSFCSSSASSCFRRAWGSVVACCHHRRRVTSRWLSSSAWVAVWLARSVMSRCCLSSGPIPARCAACSASSNPYLTRTPSPRLRASNHSCWCLCSFRSVLIRFLDYLEATGWYSFSIYFCYWIFELSFGPRPRQPDFGQIATPTHFHRSQASSKNWCFRSR